MTINIKRLIKDCQMLPIKGADYAALSASEVIDYAYEPDCGHAATQQMASRIAKMFQECERNVAAGALALELLRIVRPQFFQDPDQLGRVSDA